MAYYNMILTEAIFQLLEEKALLPSQEVKDRMKQLKAETKLSFQMIQELIASAASAISACTLPSLVSGRASNGLHLETNAI